MTIIFINQKKLQSLVEVIINTAIGYIIAVTAQYYVFPIFNIHIPISDDLKIGLIFTMISIARSYILRRFFNYINCR